MKRSIVIAAAMSLIATSASAFTEVGQYGGYGFIVMKTLSVEKNISIYSGHIQGIRVGERGDVTKYDVRIECANPGKIHVEEDGKYRMLTWTNRNSAVKTKPMNGGYFSIYDKFCPPKSRTAQNSVSTGKCAMTDSGKLCGRELKSYQEND